VRSENKGAVVEVAKIEKLDVTAAGKGLHITTIRSLNLPCCNHVPANLASAGVSQAKWVVVYDAL
jgi:hypothetical protein